MNKLYPISRSIRSKAWTLLNGTVKKTIPMLKDTNDSHLKIYSAAAKRLREFLTWYESTKEETEDYKGLLRVDYCWSLAVSKCVFLLANYEQFDFETETRWLSWSRNEEVPKVIDMLGLSLEEAKPLYIQVRPHSESYNLINYKDYKDALLVKAQRVSYIITMMCEVEGPDYRTFQQQYSYDTAVETQEQMINRARKALGWNAYRVFPLYEISRVKNPNTNQK